MLTEVLRPKNLDEFIGQKHILGKEKPYRKIIESGNISSMIFWGPPGSGKTTLAKLIPKYTKAYFESFSAVTGNLAEVRKIIKKAGERKVNEARETILFVDEIHRFNKARQDAFLPYVEDGTIILIGATTENPGFEVNAPLISRSRVLKFEKFTDSECLEIFNKAAKIQKTKWEQKAIDFLIAFSNGDARKIVNGVELASKIKNQITLSDIKEIAQLKLGVYDKAGDAHFDTISAFIKSMRGSQVDATLHYLARMITAGEDPMFIARRMLIFASEDIGNARPTAMVIATSTMQAVNMVGMPEAKLILAQCATYLASCPKSIAVTVGINKAISDLQNLNVDPIPLHLRNAANKVMKEHGYAKDHIRYPWLEKDAKNMQEYMPKNLVGKKYYNFKKYSEDDTN